MKRIIFPSILIVAMILIVLESSAQVAINTTGATPNSSAMLDITSTNKGVLIPRISNTSNIASPVQGLLVYQTSDNSFYYYNNSAWVKLSTSVSSSQWTTTGSDIYYNSGGVAIGNTSVNSKAILELNSTTKGFLLPRMTSVQVTALGTTTAGTMVYRTNGTAGLLYSDGTTFNLVGKVATASLPLSISGSNISLTGTVAVANGGTGAGDAATARTNLGLGDLSTLGSINDTWVDPTGGNQFSVPNGGTGSTSFNNGELLIGNGTNPITSDPNLNWSNSVLTIVGKIKQTQYNGSLTDGAPTTTEINGILGTDPSTEGVGFRVVIKDNDGTGLLYLIESDGTNWFYTTMSRAQ